MTGGLAWLLLVLSGVVDVAWAYATKRSEGFSNVGWSMASLIFLVLFIGMLAAALKTLPLGTAYAVWTGIGAVGSFAVGVVFFGESLTMARVTCVGMTLAGIVGLKLTS